MQSGRERLRGWIDRSKMNQTQAAELLGITPVFLSQILNGIRTPGLTNALTIEDVTGISVRSWKLNGVSESPEAVDATARKRAVTRR